jgi:toxin HigB-1
MILSYRDKRTQAFAEGKFVAAFEGFRRQAEKRLDRLEAAPDLKALRGFPGNHLESLRGNRKGQYSIRPSTISGASASNGQKAPMGRARLRSWIIIIE